MNSAARSGAVARCPTDHHDIFERSSGGQLVWRAVKVGHKQYVLKMKEIGAHVAEHSDSPDRLFGLRCRVCGREKPYRESDIVDFEGTPKPTCAIISLPSPSGRWFVTRGESFNTGSFKKRILRAPPQLESR